MQEVSVLEDNLHPFLNILSHIVPAELLFQKDIFLIINCMCNLNLSDLKIRNEEMLLRKYWFLGEILVSKAFPIFFIPLNPN